MSGNVPKPNNKNLWQGFMIAQYSIFKSMRFTPFKGALSGLKQFWATKGPLKMLKNAFYVIFKALFVFKIFKFLSFFNGHVEKWHHKKLEI